jgi:diguanylate cyclase (GGDEF)-like protein/PAS domain S-box-containing protein
MPLYVDVNRYRMQMDSLKPPPLDIDLRARIDREIAEANAFTIAHAQSLGILPQWQTVMTLWQQARSLKPGSDPRRLAGKVPHAVAVGLIYKLEDVSGLEYETNRVSQDLADIAFAKLPSAVGEAFYASLLGQNAKIGGALSIPDRVVFARLLNSVSPDGGDWDVNTDDWNDLVLPTLQKSRLITAADAARYNQHNATMVLAGRRLYNDLNTNVVLRERPTGDPSITQRSAADAVAATVAFNRDITGLLDSQLAQRIGYASLRNRYLYGIMLLGAVLLVGIMLLVAEITARRDREALVKAQQESERLSTELARQMAERALRLSEAQFRAVFDGAALGIAILDRNGSILDANAVFRHIYGENSAGVLEGHESEFSELMLGERDLFEFEQHVMTPDGHEAWTDSTVSLVNDDAGNPYFAICMFRDLTELKRSERRMLHDMTHDTLTGLPNRALFETKVREQFLQLKASPESSFAVLFVDLDRYKDINESLGHDSGDFVISQVAHRLRAAIEAADVVARLGSDEFSVLVRSLPDVLHVEVIARRVLSALSKPVALGNRSIFISASVGIALGSSNYRRGEDVMRKAAAAHGSRFSTRACTRAPKNACSLRPICAWQSNTANSICCISPSSKFRTARSPDAKRCCAGITLPKASSAPRTSCRWPSKPASPHRLDASCCGPRARKSHAGSAQWGAARSSR